MSSNDTNCYEKLIIEVGHKCRRQPTVVYATAVGDQWTVIGQIWRRESMQRLVDEHG